MNNKHKLVAILMVIGLLSFHCGGGEDETPPAPADPILVGLQLNISTNYSTENSNQPVRLEVLGIWDDGATGRISDYTILVDGVDQGKLSNINLAAAGEYQLKAMSGELESAVQVLTVRPTLELDTQKFIVIFHIVHDGEPIGSGYNIEASRIDYQMELLENTFERRNPYTPNSTMPMMDFELATVDPNGNVLAEPGINRVQRPNQETSVLFENWMWDHYWDPDYYINVWVGDTKNGYSWGIYPSLPCDVPEIPAGLGCADLELPNTLEGIALELNNLWEENWVFPHEMGHVFGLFHIFSGSGCGIDADHCADTQQYNRAAYENGTDHVTRESCSGAEFTSFNIMDYWRQPRGQRDLSYDQVLRMRQVIAHGNFRGTKSLATGTPRKMERPGGG